MDGVDGLHRCRHGGDKPVEELHASWAVTSYIYLLCPYLVSCYRLPKSPTMIPPRERRKDEPIKKMDRMRQRDVYVYVRGRHEMFMASSHPPPTQIPLRSFPSCYFILFRGKKGGERGKRIGVRIKIRSRLCRPFSHTTSTGPLNPSPFFF